MAQATANGICCKALASWSIVLMARIVDAAGVALRPSDVIGLEYSAYEVDPFWPEQLTVLRGHHAVPLAAREVLLDSLRVGRFWSLDDVGHNFRHELTFDWRERSPNAEQRFEVAYRLTMVHGGRTTVRFKLRCTTLENPLPSPPRKGEGAGWSSKFGCLAVTHSRIHNCIQHVGQ